MLIDDVALDSTRVGTTTLTRSTKFAIVPSSSYAPSSTLPYATATIGSSPYGTVGSSSYGMRVNTLPNRVKVTGNAPPSHSYNLRQRVGGAVSTLPSNRTTSPDERTPRQPSRTGSRANDVDTKARYAACGDMPIVFNSAQRCYSGQQRYQPQRAQESTRNCLMHAKVRQEPFTLKWRRV